MLIRPCIARSWWLTLCFSLTSIISSVGNSLSLMFDFPCGRGWLSLALSISRREPTAPKKMLVHGLCLRNSSRITRWTGVDLTGEFSSAPAPSPVISLDTVSTHTFQGLLRNRSCGLYGVILEVIMREALPQCI